MLKMTVPRCGSVVVSSPFLAPAILSNEPRRTAQTAWASALAELGGTGMGIRQYIVTRYRTQQLVHRCV